VDVVSANAPLEGYKLVVAPSLNVLPKDIAGHLLEYVRGGGHSRARPPFGDEGPSSMACSPRDSREYLTEALGGRVGAVLCSREECADLGAWGSGDASIWGEQLGSLASDVKTLLSYGKSNGWLDDQPAVVTRG